VCARLYVNRIGPADGGERILMNFSASILLSGTVKRLIIGNDCRGV